MPNDNDQRSKYYCLTENNYGPDSVAFYERLVQQKVISYIIIGKEIGDSGTRHLQCYLELPTRMRFGRLKTILQQGVHIERRKGSAEQAKTYCEKDGDFVAFGQMQNILQGTRNDIIALHVALDSGANLRTISEEFFGSFLKYQRGITAYRSIHGRKRNWETRVYILVGATGLGKTRLAKLKTKDPWVASFKLQWFDGYDGQNDVILDEFTGSSIDIKNLLRLLDRYSMQVPIKGGFTQWSPRTIFICSNLNFEEWYTGAHPEHVRALWRRVTSLWEFDEGTFDRLKMMPF